MSFYKDLKEELNTLKVGGSKKYESNIRSIKTMVSMINREDSKFFFSTKKDGENLLVTKNRIKINKTKVLNDMSIGTAYPFDIKEYDGLHSLSSKISSEKGYKFEVKKIAMVKRIS